MRTLGRILIGAGIGCAAVFAFLVCLILFTEGVLYPRGFRYDDMTLAYFSWMLLITAPIIGGWKGWVTR